MVAPVKDAQHRAEHRRVVAARPEIVYGLVADVSRWPVLFGPSVHVEVLESDGRDERFRLWASTNDEVSNWVSRRSLDPVRLVVEFEQERTRSPMAAMGGSWEFLPRPGGETEVVLRHHFTPVAGREDAVDWITRALDSNGEAELTALQEVTGLNADIDEIAFSFTDAASAPPRAAAAAYDFLRDAGRWPERLPHVAALDLTETPDGVQTMRMETRTADGATHTTRSIRVCLPARSIVYKQTTLPKLLLGHSGRWDVTEDGLLTATHTVLLDPRAVRAEFGPGFTLAAARAKVQEVLAGNSRTTMDHAVRFAAGAGR